MKNSEMFWAEFYKCLSKYKALISWAKTFGVIVELDNEGVFTIHIDEERSICYQYNTFELAEAFLNGYEVAVGNGE